MDSKWENIQLFNKDWVGYLPFTFFVCVCRGGGYSIQHVSNQLLILNKLPILDKAWNLISIFFPLPYKYVISGYIIFERGNNLGYSFFRHYMPYLLSLTWHMFLISITCMFRKSFFLFKLNSELCCYEVRIWETSLHFLLKVIFAVNFPSIEQYLSTTDRKWNTRNLQKHLPVSSEYAAINLCYHKIRTEVFAQNYLCTLPR